MRKTLDSLEYYVVTGSKVLTAGVSTDVVTVNFPHAGKWLVLSYMDLNKDDTNTIYVHVLNSSDMANSVRSTPRAGGGSVNWIITSGSSAVCQGYIASANITARVKVAYICLS